MKTKSERLSQLKAIMKKHRVSARILQNITEAGLYDYEPFQVKNVKDVIDRAAVSTIMARLALDLYEAETPEMLIDEAKEKLRRYNVEEKLLSSERKVLEAPYDESLCDTIAWRIESANLLLWYLGLTDDIADLSPGKNSDLLRAICSKIEFCDSVLDRLEPENIAVRSGEELFEILELLRLAQWITRNAMISGYSCGRLFYDVVRERRRAAEWLSDVSLQDWEDAPMDT